MLADLVDLEQCPAGRHKAHAEYPSTYPSGALSGGLLAMLAVGGLEAPQGRYLVSTQYFERLNGR